MCDAKKFALFVACEKCATGCATSSFPGNPFPFKAEAFAEASLWVQHPVTERTMRSCIGLQESHGFHLVNDPSWNIAARSVSQITSRASLQEASKASQSNSDTGANNPLRRSHAER